MPWYLDAAARTSVAPVRPRRRCYGGADTLAVIDDGGVDFNEEKDREAGWRGRGRLWLVAKLAVSCEA